MKARQASTVTVSVLEHPAINWVARVGRGQTAKTASSTSSAARAVTDAAAKFFGVPAVSRHQRIKAWRTAVVAPHREQWTATLEDEP